MKKFLSLLLAAVLLLAPSVPAFADGTTTLTTEVPPATYTLSIPADQTIAFNATNVNIGNVTVPESSGFSVGKNLKVTVTYSAFTSDTASTTIPFVLNWYEYNGNMSSSSKVINSGGYLTFKGTSSGSVNVKASGSNYSIDHLFITMNSSDWGKALGGTYTATITFTSEVVAG